MTKKTLFYCIFLFQKSIHKVLLTQNGNAKLCRFFIFRRSRQQIIIDEVIRLLCHTARHLAAAELEIRDFEARERILKGALSVIKDKYDYIFIDCPPALGLLTINALVASNKVIIPCPCEFYALEGIVQLSNTIESIKEYSNPDLDILGVLVTMYNSRLNISQSIMNDLRNYYGNLIFKTTVVRNVRLAEAPAYGTPIIYLDKYSKGAQNYIAVSKEVIERAEHNNY